jgi:hypothetical protein
MQRFQGSASPPAPHLRFRALLAIAITAAALGPGCGSDRSHPAQGSARVQHFARAECLKLELLYPTRDHRPCSGQRRVAVARAKRLLEDIRRLRRRGDGLSPPERARALRRLRRERFVGGRFSARQFQRATGLTDGDLAVFAEWLYAPR